MTKKQVIVGGSVRCGKSISQSLCPDCRIPLRRIDTLLYECPLCHKKVKALAKELDISYGYYTDNKVEKRLKDLFRHNVMNCSDMDRLNKRRGG